MSNERKNERPAFPAYSQCSWKDGKLDEFYGMTLRDYFAARAMQGIIAMHSPYAQVSSTQTAESAYRLADAMLKAREQ